MKDAAGPLEAPFIATARRLIAEARDLGAAFRPDGGWEMDPARNPLPNLLADRLRVNRTAVKVVLADE